MAAIESYIMQVQNYAAILTQSGDGMVSMAGRMIEQAINGIKEELKAAPAAEAPKKTRGGSKCTLKFNYAFGLDKDKLYSRNDMAKLFQVSEIQFRQVFDKICARMVMHSAVNGRTILYNADAVLKVRELIYNKYGYDQPPAYLAEPEKINWRTSSPYTQEYEEQLRREQYKDVSDPEWPDAMPDSLKDYDYEE